MKDSQTNTQQHCTEGLAYLAVHSLPAPITRDYPARAVHGALLCHIQPEHLVGMHMVAMAWVGPELMALFQE
jgi:hypothetical protein